MEVLKMVLNWSRVLLAGAALWLGDLPTAVKILLALMAIDIFAGVIAAGKAGKVSSSVAWSGMTKKIVTMGVIALAYLIGTYLNGPTLGAPFGELAVGFYIAVESISILENARAVGIPIPDFLRDALASLQEEKTPPRYGNSEGAKG